MDCRSEWAGYEPLPAEGTRNLTIDEEARLRHGGENALHIAVINQREDWILYVLGAADDTLLPNISNAKKEGPSMKGLDQRRQSRHTQLVQDNMQAAGLRGAAVREQARLEEGRSRWLLTDAELFSVLSQKADGPAFSDPPALHFGSTVMAFAAVFGMRRLLTHVLSERFPEGHVFHKVPPQNASACCACA